MLQFGDPVVFAFDHNLSAPLTYSDLGDTSAVPRYIPNGIAYRHYEGNCPSACSRKLLSAPVTAFRTILHMHQVFVPSRCARSRTLTARLHRRGRTIFMTRTRDGVTEVIKFIEYWNFGFQDGLNSSYDLQPGDSISVHCIMDTSRMAAPGVAWGFSSFQEMVRCCCLVRARSADARARSRAVHELLARLPARKRGRIPALRRRGVSRARRSGLWTLLGSDP